MVTSPACGTIFRVAFTSFLLSSCYIYLALQSKLDIFKVFNPFLRNGEGIFQIDNAQLEYNRQVRDNLLKIYEMQGIVNKVNNGSLVEDVERVDNSKQVEKLRLDDLIENQIQDPNHSAKSEKVQNSPELDQIVEKHFEINENRGFKMSEQKIKPEPMSIIQNRSFLMDPVDFQKKIRKNMLKTASHLGKSGSQENVKSQKLLNLNTDLELEIKLNSSSIKFNNKIASNQARKKFKSVPIILMSQWKSGSRYVGQIFNLHTNSFYLVEPLINAGYRNPGQPFKPENNKLTENQAVKHQHQIMLDYCAFWIRILLKNNVKNEKNVNKDKKNV